MLIRRPTDLTYSDVTPKSVYIKRREFLRAMGIAGAAAFAGTAVAQETINSASVSGRVTDPQGRVVPGAQIRARQTQTNVTAEAVTAWRAGRASPGRRRRPQGW